MDEHACDPADRGLPYGDGGARGVPVAGVDGASGADDPFGGEVFWAVVEGV